jgi:Domain of unknown function (DUF4258)
MAAEARRAIKVIRECIKADRYALTDHFYQRMEERGLFWPDVELAIDNPKDVMSQGMDEYHRPKWIISGPTASGADIEIVCAIEIDENQTEFITLYWED